MSLTIRRLKGVKTVSDLETLELEIGKLTYDIGYRGGNLGFYGSAVAKAVGVKETQLPSKFGVYCNYLGGGLRGSVCTSGFSKDISEKKAKLLIALAEACKRAYINIEDELLGLNDEIYPDGDVNWEALGTEKCRAAGVVSAY